MLLGVILSADKTNITALCGGCIAHLLLLSLANIRILMCLKLSLNFFMLIALLPVFKFMHKNRHLHSLLKDRLIHECLDVVLEPVKKTAKCGVETCRPL